MSMTGPLIKNKGLFVTLLSKYATFINFIGVLLNWNQDKHLVTGISLKIL
jgi:hypothetical protein